MHRLEGPGVNYGIFPFLAFMADRFPLFLFSTFELASDCRIFGSVFFVIYVLRFHLFANCVQSYMLLYIVLFSVLNL